ncbi:MAG: hypothetical protein KGI75_18005, partial [Rhizobiaceae bacterium]|nr:hypothetical protein [Rhizobiaceae bacterium]
SFGKPAVQRMIVDIQICGGIARFFAEKFRAACWAELFVATKVSKLIEPVIDHARRSVMAWQTAADVSRDLYHDDLTYGPQSWLRGSWHARLPEMQAEILDLESLRGGGKTESVQASPAVQSAIDALVARKPVLTQALNIEAPASFRAGSDFTVNVTDALDEAPVLHYRHVNQAERWKAMAMTRNGQGYAAVIPGEYTNSRFHLQYFVSARTNGRAVLSPGLADDLANEPYRTALQI